MLLYSDSKMQSSQMAWHQRYKLTESCEAPQSPRLGTYTRTSKHSAIHFGENTKWVGVKTCRSCTVENRIYVWTSLNMSEKENDLLSGLNMIQLFRIFCLLPSQPRTCYSRPGQNNASQSPCCFPSPQFPLEMVRLCEIDWNCLFHLSPLTGTLSSWRFPSVQHSHDIHDQNDIFSRLHGHSHNQRTLHS